LYLQYIAQPNTFAKITRGYAEGFNIINTHHANGPTVVKVEGKSPRLIGYATPYDVSADFELKTISLPDADPDGVVSDGVVSRCTSTTRATFVVQPRGRLSGSIFSVIDLCSDTFFKF
jgi:hypothetical protein